jgi:hypothetical protein
VIDASDLLRSKRADLERLAAYLGVRVWPNDDDYGLALRIAHTLRVVQWLG